MAVPPVITILLVGLSGSGKSSLVNLMYSVLARSGLIPFAQTSSNAGLHMGSLSLSLSEYSFCFFAFRGVFQLHDDVFRRTQRPEIGAKWVLRL